MAKIIIRAHTFFKGFAGRTLLLVLGAILTFITVLSLLLFLGIGRLLSSWHERETQGLHDFIQERLESLALEAIGTGEESSSADVARVLEGVPYNPSWIVVTGNDDRLLYFYRKEEGTGQARNFLRRMQDIEDWHEVRSEDGTLYFRYSTLIPAFDEQESNRLLLSASQLILFWGLGIASIVAILYAWVFARPLKRQTTELAMALQGMAKGERDVLLPDCPVREFNHIAKASAILLENLKHEEALRRQWAADIAHDLRTPLSVLKGQVEGLIDGVFLPEPDRLSRLAVELGKLESLVDSLALLSRIETPGFIPRFKAVEVENFLIAMADRFTDPASRSKSSIEVKTDSGVLDFDPALMERALGNLLSNALQYGRKGSVIVLGFKTGSGFFVENHGVMGEEKLPYVFDRLYRGTKARETEGSGLGLAIVKAIVEAHHWHVQVVSDEKLQKTRFTISFT